MLGLNSIVLHTKGIAALEVWNTLWDAASWNCTSFIMKCLQQGNGGKWSGEEQMWENNKG